MFCNAMSTAQHPTPTTPKPINRQLKSKSAPATIPIVQKTHHRTCSITQWKSKKTKITNIPKPNTTTLPAHNKNSCPHSMLAVPRRLAQSAMAGLMNKSVDAVKFRAECTIETLVEKTPERSDSLRNPRWRNS